jgi:hypothetical protein
MEVLEQAVEAAAAQALLAVLELQVLAALDCRRL